jgi:hypothetical protein
MCEPRLPGSGGDDRYRLDLVGVDGWCAFGPVGVDALA